VITVYGQMDGGAIRSRTVHVLVAMQAWLHWFGLVFAASESDPLIVTDGDHTYRVWSAA